MGIDIFIPDCILGLGYFYFKGRNMTKQDIIRMAQDAQMPFYWRTNEITYLDKVERFAALVASAEREACAKVADGWPDYDVQGLAEAIRARGKYDTR
jgi:hypothetical protein